MAVVYLHAQLVLSHRSCKNIINQMYWVFDCRTGFPNDSLSACIYVSSSIERKSKHECNEKD